MTSKAMQRMDRWLQKVGAPAPWAFSEEERRLVDANGEPVLTVDGAYTLNQAGHICTAILIAVNTVCGWQGELSTDHRFYGYTRRQ